MDGDGSYTVQELTGIYERRKGLTGELVYSYYNLASPDTPRRGTR